MPKPEGSFPYPAPHAPETWEMDDIFSRLLERQTALWARKGYQWEWAAEFEFTPQTIDEYEFYLKQNGIGLRDGEPLEREIQNVHAQYKNFVANETAPNVALARQTLQELLDFYQAPENAAYIKNYLSHPKVSTSLETAISTLQDMGAQLDESEQKLLALIRIPEEDRNQSINGDIISQKEIQRFAVSGILLAQLYTLPRAQGGLGDVVEPRFGNYDYGQGWWDGPGNGEFRLQPTDAATFMQQYHDLIAHVTHSCNRFGLIANVASTQLNFNIRRLSDGKNMMEIDSDADAEFHKRVLAGIFRLHDEAPHIKSDLRGTDNRREFLNLSAGTSKYSGLNMHTMRWEVRRSSNNGYMHASRELAFWMTGAAYGVFEIGNIDRYIKRNKLHIKDIVQPVVRHKYLKTSALARVLSNSTLLPNRHLEPSLSITNDYADALLQEIGEQNAQAYQRKTSEKDFVTDDLRSYSGWVFFLSELSFDAENRPVTDGLHPELQAAFENLEVTGLRRVVTGDTLTPTYGSASLRRTIAQLTSRPILKRFLPAHDLENLKDGFEEILKRRETAHALERSAHIQQNIVLNRSMHQQLDDSLRLVNKDEDPAPQDLSGLISRLVIEHVIMPYIEESSAAVQSAMRLMRKKDRKKLMETTRADILAKPNRLKTDSALIAADLEAQADKLLKKNPGNNSLPLLSEDFRKAAAFLKKDALDPRLYAEGIATQFAQHLSNPDIPFEEVDAVGFIMLLNETFETAPCLAYQFEQFTAEDCVDIYRDSFATLTRVFKEASDAIEESDGISVPKTVLLNMSRQFSRSEKDVQGFRDDILKMKVA